MQDWEQEARNLHKEWDSPDLWPRIADRLEAEQGRSHRGRIHWTWAVAAMLAVGIGVGAWMGTRPAHVPFTAAAPKLLTDQALDELEANEAKYLESIEKLASLAGPSIQAPPSPLVAAYRERLTLLDNAIAELREEAESNPLNAHLRLQLATLYREKQETLQEVLNHAQKN